MKKIQGLLAVAAATLAFGVASARADTVWDFTYSGSGVSASGSFVTVGNGATPSQVTSMTGTYSDATTTGAITLITLSGSPAYAPDGMWIADNLYGGSPKIDFAGLLFLAGAQEVNLYTDMDTNFLVSGTVYNGSPVFTPVTFKAVAEAAPVPEPGSIAMLLAGLGALAFVSRRKVRN